MFCPECGMRFIKSIEKNGKKIDVCVLGHEIEREKPKLSLVQKKIKKNIDEDNFIPIEETDRAVENHIITNIPCPFCGKKKCFYLRPYTLRADEGEIFFMKCLSCGKNFRSGSGGACGT